jgi:hypothetical protein
MLLRTRADIPLTRAKTDDRLQRIIDAYAYSDFALVTYLTADAGLAAN